MKRLALVLSLLALPVLLPAPAHADFHPACSPPSSAEAHTDLGTFLQQTATVFRTTVNPIRTAFRYTGTVYCPGAAVNITSVVLKRADGSQLGSTVSQSCAASDSPCSAVGEVSSIGETGSFTVSMVFSVPPYLGRTRTATFTISATGAVQQTGASGDPDPHTQQRQRAT